MTLYQIITIILFLLPSTIAVAASDALTSPASPISNTYLFQSLLYLLLIILMIVVFAFFFKKFNYGGFSNNRVINVLASQSLGARERVALIDVGKKQILIGITNSSVQTLHVFDEAIVVKNTTTDVSFLDNLKQALSQGSKK